MVEYILGYLRRRSHFKDEAHIAINSFAKQQFAKEILIKYDLDSTYFGRKIEDINTKWNLFLCDLKTNLIAEEINSLMEGNLNFQDTESLK